MFNFFFVTYCDAPQPWQIGVQDPATPSMEGMVSFHDYLIFFLILIGSFVFWMLIQVLIKYNEYINKTANKFTHSSNLEIVWTLVPAVILIFISVPSMSLLYSSEEISSPTLTVKIIGHQWYWSYEYSDFVLLTNNSISYDSYMVGTHDLPKGTFRLLEVDNRLVLPTFTNIRLIVTSSDVIHSWAIPSFGIKIDACPGRLSQGALYIKRPGTFYGQCSEICGVNHGFMPIVVRVVSFDNFLKWISLKLK